MKKSKTRERKDLSVEEKIMRALQGILILQAANIGLSGGEIRKILRINKNEITPILKAATKAIKKHTKKTLNAK